MTTGQCYNDFFLKLQSVYEEREADNIADWVFEKVTGLKKVDRRYNKNSSLKSDYAFQLEGYLQELLQYKPVQYVLNEAWFFKMKFYVNEHVLIPRPETEELVSWIINDIKNEKYACKILDIGTGSGCIAVSIKNNIVLADITATDISNEALEVAGENARALKTNIDFFQVDFLNESSWSSFDHYNIIVSNPPYIPEFEKEKLSKNVTSFEPSAALFVPNNDPYIFYKKIAIFLKSHLRSNGKMYVEIHELHSKETEQIFSQQGFKTEIRKDLYGKERMIKACR